MKRTHSAAATLVFMLLAWLISAAPAHAADDFVQSSDPAPHQELTQVPGWVTLVFKGEADASLATIVVLDESGSNVAAGPMIVEGTNVTTQLRSGLRKGTYTVYYRTTDEFGEPRGGSYQFAYGKGDWTPQESEVWKGESAQPTILDDAGDPPSPSPTPTEPTSEVTPTPSSSGSGSSTVVPTPQPSQSPSDGLGWVVGAAAAAAALTGGALLLWWLRRRG